MEQEPFDPEFQKLYNEYIRTEVEESGKLYAEIAPELTLPVRRFRWIYPVAAAILIVMAGIYVLSFNKTPFKTKPKYTKAEVRDSLEKTIRALSVCSKTVRVEFTRVGDLTAMADAIKPGKKGQSANQKSESNTSKN